MTKKLVQRYIVCNPEEASRHLPQNVALTDANGGALLGTLQKAESDTTLKQLKARYNALVDALAAAGLAKVAEAGEAKDEAE